MASVCAAFVVIPWRRRRLPLMLGRRVLQLCCPTSSPVPFAFLCRLPQPQLLGPAGLRHQQHAALPSPRRERCCRIIARAAAAEAPAAAVAEPTGKGRAGASGIGSGIKLENVRVMQALQMAACVLLLFSGALRCTTAPTPPIPRLHKSIVLPAPRLYLLYTLRRWPSPSRTSRC